MTTVNSSISETRIASRWLLWASAYFVVLGVTMMGSAWGPVAQLMGGIVDLLFWPWDGQPDALGPVGTLGFAMAGGLTAGLGAIFGTVAVDPVLFAQQRVRQALVRGMAVWFVVDSVGSSLAGAWLNTVLNLVFLLVVIPPLVRRTQ